MKKNGGAKDFDFKQKNQFEKKNRETSRFEGSGLQLWMIPYFFLPTPEKSHFMSFILGLCLFPVIYPKQAMDLEKIEIRKKIFESSGFCDFKTLKFYYIVIPIFSKPFTGRIVKYPVDGEVV